ncbi:MAG: hypothetical protein OXG72_07685 [Acidobacteria bacterium]|nr:hypothetical protein [Acidobacteriota bacterium]MCY4120786.1 hypothetical protein [Acidobacteriota bacterium]
MSLVHNREDRAAARPPLPTVATLVCCLALVGAVGHAAESDRGWFDAIADWFSGSDDSDDVADATPSDVYRTSLDVLAEIRILREELGADDFPAEAEAQDDRAPLHVYAKSLEVMGKVSRVQRRLGMPVANVGQIPVKVIEPGDVLASLSTLLDQLREIKSQMVIAREIDPAPLETGKTTSMVYKNLADASFQLDGLVGRPLNPNDVYLNTMHLLDDLALIAAELGAPVREEAPAVEARKTPKDVAQQVLRASYKMVNLQTRLGMDASSVPTLTLVRVTPSEVFDATNMLLAETMRVKHHLGINTRREERVPSRNKQPTDVFAQVLLVIMNLDALMATVP